MNSSLQEMHIDIQRLAAQQHQLKTNDIILNEQKHQILRQQHPQYPQQMYHVQQPPQPYYNNSVPYGSPNQYMSMTSVPQYASPPPDNQFYLHDQPRRTWKSPQTQSFMLHEPTEPHHEQLRYQNGDHRTGFSLSQQHMRQNQVVHSEPNTPQRASPQHRNTNNVHRQISQISQLMGDGDNNKTSFATLAQHSESFDKSKNQSGIIHHAIPTPPVDDMEPQNISFIGKLLLSAF